MHQDWNTDEIIEYFTLLPSEFKFLGSSDPHNHLGKALLLKFFQREYRFPENISEISDVIIEYVAHQLDLPKEVVDKYDWEGRSIKEHRKDIREQMGFRPTTRDDQTALRTWLMDEVIPHEYRPTHLEQLIYQQLRRKHIEPPTKNRVSRIIQSAMSRYQKAFFVKTNSRLSANTRSNLRQLIDLTTEIAEEMDLEETTPDAPNFPIHEIKAGAGEPKVKNIKRVATRLKRLQEIGLPPDLFADIPLPFLQQYKQQVAVESISHLRRRDANPQQHDQLYTMLAAFCWVRQREITDYLVDLFIHILNDIRLRAKSRVEKQLVADYIKVGGKQQLLFRLVQAMWNNPAGVIEAVLYPIVGKDRLEALVEEARHQGPYHQSIQTQISGSYTHHYRQILPHDTRPDERLHIWDTLFRQRNAGKHPKCQLPQEKRLVEMDFLHCKSQPCAFRKVVLRTLLASLLRFSAALLGVTIFLSGFVALRRRFSEVAYLTCPCDDLPGADNGKNAPR